MKNLSLMLVIGFVFFPMILVLANTSIAMPIVPGYTVQTYAEVDSPHRMAFDSDGILYVGHYDASYTESFYIRRIGVGGTPIRNYGNSGLSDADAVLVDTDGQISGTPGTVIVGCGYTNGGIYAIYPDETVELLFSPNTAFYNPTQLIFDNDGTLLILDPTYQKVSQTTGKPNAPTMLFSTPTDSYSIAVDIDDRIFISDNLGKIRIYENDELAEFVTLPYSGVPYNLTMAFTAGNEYWDAGLYVVSDGTGYLSRFDSEGQQTILGTGFNPPPNTTDLVFGPDGALYVSTTGNEILRIVPEPVIPITWVQIEDPGFTGEMSKYETTNAQYCQFLNEALASGDIAVSGNSVLGSNGTNPGADFMGQVYYNLTGTGNSPFNGSSNGGASRINWTGGSFTVDSGFKNHPVTYVSWYGATAFCNYYGYRLPTEWEWQAVADYDGSYLYGPGPDMDNNQANYFGSVHPDGTTVVGSFGTYGYGLADISGNVFEWTSSLYDSEHDYRVDRGGCWTYDKIRCSVLYINYNSPYDMGYDLGFRVVQIPEPVIDALVDINPDSLNKYSKGQWITVYITLPAGYDVSQIDVDTIAITSLTGASCQPDYQQAVDLSFSPQIGDRDEDGIPDLTVKFNRQELIANLCLDDVAITVEGKLITEEKFNGTDHIRVIDREN
jgi:formylglycine-generating enzyme required for sulfatase activity